MDLRISSCSLLMLIRSAVGGDFFFNFFPIDRIQRCQRLLHRFIRNDSFAVCFLMIRRRSVVI